MLNSIFEHPSLRRLAALFLFLGILAFVTGLASPPVADAGKAKFKVGHKPPDLTWTSVSGEAMSWDELRQDRPLVMVFWATWCTVCKKDWPKLKKIAAKYEEMPLAPVWAAVSLGEKPDRVEKVARERELPGWIIADPKEANGEALGIEFVPLVCILDANGVVSYLGEPKIGTIDKLLGSLTSRNKEAVQ